MEKIICAKSELCVFEPAAVQVVVEHAMWCDIHPSSTLDKANSIEFFVNASTTEYLDLNDSVLFVNAKITGKDLRPLPPTQTTVSYSNYLLAALFDDVTVLLNDTKIEGGSRLYGYKSAMQNELKFSNATKVIQLGPAGYERDDAKRLEWVNNGEIQLMGALNVDFFQTQAKYLLPGVNVRILLNRSKNEFCVNVSGGTLKPQVHITDATLFVRRVRCAPAVLIGHELGLNSKNAIYPYQKTETNTFTISEGSQSHIQENIFRGSMPKFVIVSMVKGSGYAGSYKEDPFTFSHFDVTFMGLFRDGQSLPYRTGYTPNFAGKKYVRDYFISIIQNMEHMRRDCNNGITSEEFNTGGRTFFTFNLTPDFSCNQAQVPRDGNLRLDLKFEKSLTESINVIIMGIFDTEIQISKQRNIFIR